MSYHNRRPAISDKIVRGLKHIRCAPVVDWFLSTGEDPVEGGFVTAEELEDARAAWDYLIALEEWYVKERA